METAMMMMIVTRQAIGCCLVRKRRASQTPSLPSPAYSRWGSGPVAGQARSYRTQQGACFSSSSCGHLEISKLISHG
jgi:hypothetical protein